MKIKIARAPFTLGSLLLGFAVASSVPAQETPASADTVVVRDNFNAGRENWDWSGSIEKGGLVLTAPDLKQYAGAQTLLKPVLTLPDDGTRALRIRFTIEQLENVAEGRTVSEARFFLIPAPLKNPTFADSYGSPDALTLLLSANSDRGTISLFLFRKMNQTKGGFGDKIYEATMPIASLPVGIDWHIGKAAYHIGTTPKVQSVDGARLGNWTLAGTPLAGDLRYVMRAINVVDGVQTQLRVSGFSITDSRLPE